MLNGNIFILYRMMVECSGLCGSNAYKFSDKVKSTCYYYKQSEELKYHQEN